MKKGLTELVFVVDMSGSMYDLTNDTLGGFNSMLEKQKAVDGKAYVSTVLFNNSMHVLHDRVDICKVQPMTHTDYRAGGGTALLDAVGSAVHHIANVHKYARAEDVPERTIFVIITDGMENSSSRYNYSRVKQMIGHEQEKYGWEFIFLGANIDSARTAMNLGISESHASNYVPDAQGTKLAYASVDAAISSARQHRSISNEWKNCVESDHKKRG